MQMIKKQGADSRKTSFQKGTLKAYTTVEASIYYSMVEKLWATPPFFVFARKIGNRYSDSLKNVQTYVEI